MEKIRVRNRGIQGPKMAFPVNKNSARTGLIRYKFHSQTIGALIRSVNTMNLDELLEASKVVEMGIKGEEIPMVQSIKALKYAEKVLSLSKKPDTKLTAERMIRKLNVQILETNRETTNPEKSKRLYHRLMAEE